MEKLTLTQYNESQERYFERDSETSLKVFMATCPQSHPPTSPHPALPYLKGYLNETLPNTTTTTKDLDAIYYSYIFSPEKLVQEFSPEDAERTGSAYLAQQDESAYKNIPEFIKNHKTLEDALDKISSSHRQRRLLRKEGIKFRGNTFTYVSEKPANDRASILEAIAENARKDNLFYEFYANEIVPHIERKGYDVVGLSVFLTDQILPTFLLSAMIKSQNPNIKVILGGNYLTRFRDVLSKDDELNKRLFDYVDAVITHEGEVPFRDILQKLQRGQSFENINQVIYRDENGRIISNFDPTSLPALDMNKLPRPDFDGIFTDLENRTNVFWTPSPVISLYTQRGCSFAGGCDFCTIMSANNKPNSKIARSPQKVAEDISFYQQKYGAKVFSFGNETLSREFMLGLSEELKKRGLEATIDGYTRTDQLIKQGEVDREGLSRIGKYFRFLQIGVESADEETLKSMRKGRKSATDAELFEAMFQNGIYPHAFIMTGFPPSKIFYQGKEREDYINYYTHSFISSLRWLRENARNIATYKATQLVIPRDDRKMVHGNGESKIAENYSHEIQLKNGARDLEFNLPYEKINGSGEFDARTTELFDMIRTPFRTYTHNAVYHQRMFNWEEGIRWSLENPFEADEVSKSNLPHIRRTLLRLWNEAVGKEYVVALRELSKKGGINSKKREQLQKLVDDIRAKNIIAARFPEGILSFDDLLRIN